jgi:hypothetical protein
VAVPVIDVSLAVESNAQLRRIGTVDPAIHFFREDDGDFGDTRTFADAREATGIGDVHLLGKYVFHKQDLLAVAAGFDLRLPSGEERDLLGAGALGARPFVAISSTHRVLSTHFNLGYQWNGDSVLAGDGLEHEEDLPDQVGYAAGFDVGVHEQVTLAFDLIGQVLFNTPRVVPAEFHALDGRTVFPDIDFTESSVSQTNVAAGAKINVLGRLLLDLNCLFALDDGGLRDRFTPLVGIEYSF